MIPSTLWGLKRLKEYNSFNFVSIINEGIKLLQLWERQIKRKGYYFQIFSLEFFSMLSGMLNVTNLILFFRPQCYGSHCCGCGCGCATQPPPPHSTPHSYHHHDHFSSVPPNNQHYINNSNDEVQQQQTVRGSNPELYQQMAFKKHCSKLR